MRKNDLGALVEAELIRHPWSSLEVLGGFATDVPRRIRVLLTATSAAEAKSAYWKLENHIVVQGGVFEAASHSMQVFLAALANNELPFFVKVAVFELCFQILNGMDESDSEWDNIERRCREVALEGIWLFYRELLGEHHDAVREIIELIDPEPSRLQRFEALLKQNK